jgi:transcriptional regulator GlxA family with amidase domain
MSPRNLIRHFVQAAGITPHEFIERARVDAARMMLEGSGRSLKAAAFDCGFGSADRMRIVFSTRLGVTPVQYRASSGRLNRIRSRAIRRQTAIFHHREDYDGTLS